MKIGAVNFLNAYPLYWGLEKRPDVELVKGIPSRLAEALLKKELDAAIISSIEFHKHRDQYNFFPDLCIAARGLVESIRFYRNSFTTFESFQHWLDNSDKIKIYYDVATRSSLAMLMVLCNHFGHLSKIDFIEINPPYETKIRKLENHEGLLLIGDSALKFNSILSLDMGDLYWQTFQRSFVYAMWVYPKETHVKKNNMRQILLEAYQRGLNEFNKLLKDALKNFGFSKAFTEKYLREILQYEFTDELKKDMIFFFEKYDLLLENGIEQDLK